MENFMKRYQLMRFPNGKSKAVTLSYDDGCFQDKKLGKIIDKYGIKCTFNLNSCRLADSIAKNGDFHKDLLANGHEVAVHGKLHKAPVVFARLKEFATCFIAERNLNSIMI